MLQSKGKVGGEVEKMEEEVKLWAWGVGRGRDDGIIWVLALKKTRQEAGRRWGIGGGGRIAQIKIKCHHASPIC